MVNNESTVTIFCNPNLVEGIHETNKSLDLVTNARIMRTNLKAIIPRWGKAWFSPYAITNIFSYAEMAKHHQITYNLNIEDAFVVHLPDKPVKFTRTDQGLYVFKPSIKQTTSQEVQLLNTIDENKAFYTHWQFEKAKRARDLYHVLGTPSTHDFKAILRMNIITNNPVTTKDIKIAQQIFGQDIGSLKGKTTRTKPVPVVNNYIEIPEELIMK